MTTRLSREKNAYHREALMMIFDLDLRAAVKMTRRQEEAARMWLATDNYEEAGRRLGITGQAVMVHVQRLTLRAERAVPGLQERAGHFRTAA